MTRKTNAAKAAGGGAAALFGAIEELTWREMREVAELIALQLADRIASPLGADLVAQVLGDAADSFLSAED